METKHTPGKWFVSGLTQIVSMPSQTKISNCISGNSYEEVKANAILIASAPDLLDALQDLMAAYEKDGHLLNYNVDAARCLIKTATGGS